MSAVIIPDGLYTDHQRLRLCRSFFLSGFSVLLSYAKQTGYGKMLSKQLNGQSAAGSKLPRQSRKLFEHRKQGHMSDRMLFPPTTRQDMEQRGWEAPDFIFISGDA